jgi:hypothetical protein
MSHERQKVWDVLSSLVLHSQPQAKFLHQRIRDLLKANFQKSLGLLHTWSLVSSPSSSTAAGRWKTFGEWLWAPRRVWLESLKVQMVPSHGIPVQGHTQAWTLLITGLRQRLSGSPEIVAFPLKILSLTWRPVPITAEVNAQEEQKWKLRAADPRRLAGWPGKRNWWELTTKTIVPVLHYNFRTLDPKMASWVTKKMSPHKFQLGVTKSTKRLIPYQQSILTQFSKST